MKTFLKLALTTLVSTSAFANANVSDITLPIVEENQNEGLELGYDAETKTLSISYDYMASNSCAVEAKKVKLEKGLLIDKLSFDIGSVSNDPRQMCLMVLRMQTIEVTVPAFEKNTLLTIEGQDLGFIVLSDDGQSVSFEPNSIFTTQGE